MNDNPHGKDRRGYAVVLRWQHHRAKSFQVSNDVFISEIRSAICAGILSVKVVIAQLQSQGYNTTIDVPKEKRERFLNKCYAIYQREQGL